MRVYIRFNHVFQVPAIHFISSMKFVRVIEVRANSRTNTRRRTCIQNVPGEKSRQHSVINIPCRSPCIHPDPEYPGCNTTRATLLAIVLVRTASIRFNQPYMGAPGSYIYISRAGNAACIRKLHTLGRPYFTGFDDVLGLSVCNGFLGRK